MVVLRILASVIKMGLLGMILYAGVFTAQSLTQSAPVLRSFSDNLPPPTSLPQIAKDASSGPRYSIYAGGGGSRYMFQYHPAFTFQSGAELKDGLVITGRTPHRMILFTFDDGPDAIRTPALLDKLDAVDIRAVFFLSTDRIRGRTSWEQKQIEVAKEIRRRGHLVASHGLHHVQLVLLSDQQLQYEFETSEDIFLRIFGERPWLFRPPGGARSPRIDAAIAERGYTMMLWNLGTGDVQVRSAQEVLSTFRRVLDRREVEDGNFGGIVLLHDIHSWSVEAFELIYKELLARNCFLLDTGEELYDLMANPSWFYVPRADAEVGVPSPAAEPPPDVWNARQAQIREQTRARCMKEFQLATTPMSIRKGPAS